MARPKEFDRAEALHAAMHVFWEKGYGATTTEDLRNAMGIGRQSFYDTFGDKHRTFVEAYALYSEETGAEFRRILEETPSALKAIELVLMAIPAQSASERARGCLFVNTVAELPAQESGCDLRATTAGGQLAFERAIKRAQAAGEVSKSVDSRAAGRFLFSTVQGIRLSAKAGTSPEALRDIARMALRALDGQPTTTAA